ncbi:MAG: radical SAM protein [Lachnospiraceae bacterium]|nr:radical SAM protein [Lachnospiraceae bacterium]
MASPIINSNRSDLSKEIPISTPYLLFIDPSNVCNFKCNFCAPQSKKSRNAFNKQFMEYDLFKKVIDDLQDFPEKVKVLRMYTMGEPLLNPNFCRMVTYAKEKNVANWIETVTNGSVLNPELNQRLADSGIDRIRISIESISEEGYRDICGKKINYAEFVENIKDLYERTRGKCDIYIKIVDVSVDTEEKRNIFYNYFKDICDNIYIENVVPVWPNFDEIKDKYDKPSSGIMGIDVWEDINVCPFVFYGCVVNPDGCVTPCCTDWERSIIYGNVSNKSFKEIWGGSVMKSFWINMLKGKKNLYDSCRNCDYIKYTANENIDAYAEDILKRL